MKAACPSGKRKFLDAKSAEASAISRHEDWKTRRIPLMYAYRCRHCGFFHLTKQEQRS